ncbi:MAG: EAL domain-containing protein [Myxococcota bacterium]
MGRDRPVVLVADDDPGLRLLCVVALEDAGFEVREVGDGAEAVRAFREDAPDLVLLDVMMPELDGYEACATIRSLLNGETVPIVIMTGLDDEGSIDRAYDAGATDFVPKPINHPLLVHRIRYLLRSARTANELRTAERRVTQLAYFDSLTTLPNRTFLDNFLANALARAERFHRSLAVLALDLDLFKRVNDTYGHAGGDALLREVGARIASCVRSSDLAALAPKPRPGEPPDPSDDDAVAARLGGDEFVVVLGRIRRPEDAAIVARRIADRMAEPFSIANAEVFVSVSIGIATWPENGNDAASLLDRADAALYHAKEQGRNTYQFFTDSIHRKASRRLEIETHLRSAMIAAGVIGGRTDREPGEIQVHFQPKIELGTGEVIGFEALLRWTDPALGQVNPAEFVPVCEDTGLIVPLGDWVLRQSCLQARRWAETHGHPVTVAVNLSARQFREPDLAQRVSAILAETGLEPSLLELELTESILLQDTPASARALDQLKALGIRIALDDFGTGYSSLSYLSRLPIDTLKIDRSFVNDLGHSGKSDTITAAIIALSRSLRIDVVAEGVETKSQLRFLADHGCGVIQGFLYGRAMAADRIADWWDNHDREIRLTGITPWVAANRE